MNRFLRRLGWWFQRGRKEAELQEEIAFHLEAEAREREAAGVPPDEARAEARREFGNVALIQEDARAAWGWTFLEQLVQDFRYALRVLAKSPVFTGIVILTLGLGIGANAAIFSVVNWLMLRPLPVSHPEQLVRVAVQRDRDQPLAGPSYLDYLDYRENAGAFSDMIGAAFGSVGMSADNRADRLTIAWVTGNYFSMLGVQPGIGRLIAPGEGQIPGRAPVLVLGHTFWRTRFLGDPSVVGKRVNINGRPFTIIGVVPESFSGTFSMNEPDAYLPITMMGVDGTRSEVLTKRNAGEMQVLGRLEQDVSLTQAEITLNTIALQLAQQYPDTNEGVTVRLFPERFSRPDPNAADAIPLVTTLFAILVGLVLLVACVNVVNLLLVRAASRNREFAVRAALGAGDVRLTRQLLTESVLLGISGGLAGTVIGAWAASLLSSSIRFAGENSIALDFGFDWRVFGYVAVLAVTTGFVVGVLPVLRASRLNVSAALRDAGRGASGGAARHRARNLLVMGQVAVSLVLMTAAGLFVRSLGNAQNIDLGWDPKNVLTLTMDTGQLGYDEARTTAVYRELQSRVASLPAVQSVTFGHTVPMWFRNLSGTIHVEGHVPPSEAMRPIAGYNLVGSDYFETLRIPIVRGRPLTEEDQESSRRVAVVNEFMARHFWPNGNAIGQRFSFDGPDGPWNEVVGISEQGKYDNIFEDPSMYFFAPIGQNHKSLRSIHVRTEGDPEALALAIQAEVRTLDPELLVFDVATLDHVFRYGGSGLWLLRLAATFAGAVGTLGLVLALVGVYGVASYSVAERTREIGIRMALGAQTRDILRMVSRQGLGSVLGGLLAGLTLAVILARAMSSLLFGISPIDPVTFLAVTLLLALIATLAFSVPAARATRVDPIETLRQG